MPLTFIHTADWQIGKPFRWFPEDMAGRLRAARVDVIDRIGRLAMEREAGFVVVAGDVFDQEGLPRAVRMQPVARMRGFPDVTWVLLPGNHDPATPAGLWSRLKGLLPDNVVVADTADPIEVGSDVVVLPAPLRQRISAHDPTVWMDRCETTPDRYRVGLAHGSVSGFGSEADANSLIEPARAQIARLDYLALGDWHGMQKVNARTWYSGTPEPDRFADNAPGHVLVVRLDAPGSGSEPVVEPVQTGEFTWLNLSDVLNDAAQLPALRDRIIAASGASPSRCLARLTLSGVLSVGERAAVSRWCNDLEAELAYLAVRDDGLRVRGGLTEHDLVAANDELAAAAETLQRLADAEAGEHGDDARRAGLALQLLLDAVDAVAEEEAA